MTQQTPSIPPTLERLATLQASNALLTLEVVAHLRALRRQLETLEENIADMQATALRLVARHGDVADPGVWRQAREDARVVALDAEIARWLARRDQHRATLQQLLAQLALLGADAAGEPLAS
jgi:predicted AAA+ superfamily ATPase